jgi:hypothetical protein
MAGVFGALKFSGVQTTNAVKTLVQLVAPSNHRVKVVGVRIGFHGTSNTNEPILVELVRQTSTAASTTCTPTKINAADDETLQTTGNYLFTSESTPGDIVETFPSCHPQAGFSYDYPLGQEVHVVGGTKLALRVTAAQSVTADGQLKFEE